MQVVLIKQADKELKKAPRDVVSDIFSLFDSLAKGKKLSLPICRPLFSIEKGLYELRLSGRGGEYRVFYLIKVSDAIYVIHAAKKKKQEIDSLTINLLKKRVRSIK